MKVYQKKSIWRKLFDLAVTLAVTLNALVIIFLSVENTARLAKMFGLPPKLSTFLVEVAFGLLLILRARQRALGLNVSNLLHLGYFVLFFILTTVNMYGLSMKHPYGWAAGLTISFLMWLLENILVWKATRSHEPYQKSVLIQKIDAMKEAWEQKKMQEIAWIKYDASRPDMNLVKKIRKVEEKREKIIGDDLPEFFKHFERENSPEELVARLRESEPKVIVQTPEEKEELAPIVAQRQIGFHVESMPEKTNPSRFQPNLEARAHAIKTAKMLTEILGRIPTKKELMTQGGLTDHYSRVALEALKKE